MDLEKKIIICERVSKETEKLMSSSFDENQYEWLNIIKHAVKTAELMKEFGSPQLKGQDEIILALGASFPSNK